MKKYFGFVVLFAFVLSACGDIGMVTTAPDPFRITPSRLPIIVTATPAFSIPTTSATLPPPPSLTPIFTVTSGLDLPPASATSSTFPTLPFTETFTPLPIPSVTGTFAPPLITLLGCDTGFDVTHGMGEVTNAYVIVANRNGPVLTNLCTTLTAADEGRPHPNKTRCTPMLTTGYQVTLKLTIDTTFSVNTIVEISLTSDQGIATKAGGLACRDIGSFKPADQTLGTPVPIP